MTERGQRLAMWVAAGAALVVLLYLLRGILLPFVAGMAVAYLLDPAADRLERWGLSRTLATVVIVIGFFGLVVLLVLVLYPLVIGQMIELIDNLPRLVEQLRQRLLPLIERLQAEFGSADVRDTAAEQAGKAVNWVGRAVAGLLGGGLVLVNLLSLLLITPIVAFYLLRDWDRMVERIDRWLPREHAATIRQEAREIDRVLAGFVRGQAMVSVIQGTFYAVGLTLVGLNYGVAIGLFAGLLSFIPYAGAFAGLLLTVGVALSQFWPDYVWIAVVIGVYLLGQFLEGNFVTPRLVGGAVGLHPVWVIFALLAGGAMFGFVGVLLAVPAAAVVGVLTRFGLRRYMASDLYLGRPPPAEP